MTIQTHIYNYLGHIYTSGIPSFNTSDIQDLSQRGIEVFGKRLGSPSTYERTFRNMREIGLVQVKRVRNKPSPNKREWSWEIKGIHFDDTSMESSNDS